MKTIVNAGILLGVLCAIWTFVCGFTGWYKHPRLSDLFYLVVVIEIAVLIWALRKTARQGRGYGGQVGAGLLISLLGGLIIIGSSLLFSTVVFPDSTREVIAMREAMIRAGSSPGPATDALIEAARRTTPVSEAVQGFVGTAVTGLAASLVIAIFVRARKA